MNKQPEVRAQTRQKFMDAFWKLSENKDINKISVGELVKIAGYNRSTFYEYFTDMPDLIRQVEDKLLEQLREEFLNTDMDFSNNDGDKISSLFSLMFKLNEPLYNLLGPHGDPAFFSRVKNLLLPFVADLIGISEDNDSTYLEYIGAYAESALFGLLQHWHEQEKDISEQELFSLGYDLVKYGVLETINIKKTRQSEQNPLSRSEE